MYDENMVENCYIQTNNNSIFIFITYTKYDKIILVAA